MKIMDLFSGIGGFSLGFQRAGYQFTERYKLIGNAVTVNIVEFIARKLISNLKVK
jgi:cytosine-specific methyltransferase